MLFSQLFSQIFGNVCGKQMPDAQELLYWWLQQSVVSVYEQLRFLFLVMHVRGAGSAEFSPNTKELVPFGE